MIRHTVVFRLRHARGSEAERGFLADAMVLKAIPGVQKFEQLRQVTDAYADPEARTRFFARLDWIVQSLTIVSQLFLTGYIASRLGIVALLSVVPVVTAVAFGALAVSNTLALVVVSIVTSRWAFTYTRSPGMIW